MTDANASTYKFECPCGAKLQTQTPAAATACPSCGRPWSVEWDYEIRKAKAKG